MKRLLFILATVLILLLASACNSNTASPQSSAPNNSASPSTGASGDEAIISGRIFSDDNNNGMFDNGEPGISGVTVTGDNATATTDGNGEFLLSVSGGTVTVTVDESTLGAGYILTTDNSTQTLDASGGGTVAEDIGYTMTESSETAGNGPEFSQALQNTSDMTNYHFILEMSMAGMDNSSEIWVMDNNMKFAAEGQIIYYNQSEGTMGIYASETNQLIVSPITETAEMESPFTLADEIEADAYDETQYVGTEELDGKTVYVYNTTVPEFTATYYIWADTGIIVKMETTIGGQTSTYMFKDLSIGTVTEADFAYPAGAEILDLGAFGDMGGDFDMSEFE